MPIAANEFILVADDFDDTAETLAELIRLSTRFEAVAVKDGQQAVDEALARRPRVAILDIDMPELDGIQAAGAIRHRYGEGRPLMIAQSGGINADRAEFSGMFDCVLRKPINVEKLLRLLNEAG